jgi:hypothetical protein
MTTLSSSPEAYISYQVSDRYCKEGRAYFELFDGDLVIAPDKRVAAEGSDVRVHVPCERVVVVDDEREAHGCRTCDEANVEVEGASGGHNGAVQPLCGPSIERDDK